MSFARTIWRVGNMHWGKQLEQPRVRPRTKALHTFRRGSMILRICNACTREVTGFRCPAALCIMVPASPAHTRLHPQRLRIPNPIAVLDMSNESKIEWLSEPEDHDYPAASSFLSLIYDKQTVAKLLQQLRRASITSFKAKDIFRASGLSLLGISNYHVELDRKKIKDGKRLAPLLLVRNKPNGKVIVADGYHRLCAVYSFDEDALIPCKIV